MVSREVTFYSLDAIIAVGYRVSSKEATDFRIWATNILKDNGKIQREIADKLALDEYRKYRIVQDKSYISDFDELVAETKNLNSI